MRKNLLFFVFLVIFFASSVNIVNSATLVLSPSSTSVSVNSTFTVNILLDTTGQPTYGVDINRLRFNPAILQVVDADVATAGVQVTLGSLMSVATLNSADNTGGSIQLSQLATPGNTFTGSGTFATITFRAISAGTSNVTFDFTSGNGTDTNVAGLGSDLLTSAPSASYTVSALDTTPPTLSLGAPSGSLVYTTTSATMSVTTNENATCRFSTSPGVAYASMTSTFTTTGSTSHSQSLTGLTSGSTYTRYVRCQDSSSNPNTTDYAITFSIASPPDTTAPTISAIASSAITTTGGTVTWTTNESSDTQVDYGLTTTYGQSSTLNTTLVTSHSVALTGLSSNSVYNYRVKSRDAAGNLAISANQTFTTSAPVPVQRTVALVLEGTTVRNVTGSIQYLNTSTGSVLGTTALTTNTAGQATVSLPSGLPTTVNIRPLITGYLSRNITNVDTTSTTLITVTTPTMLAGDFNADQIINSLDFSTMNTNWSTSNTLTDVNKDSIVNSLDFAYMSNNWLQIGQ
ncbi:MAG: dockerin type I domain-containing protein [Parcubacteria group bacterium]